MEHQSDDSGDILLSPVLVVIDPFLCAFASWHFDCDSDFDVNRLHVDRRQIGAR